MKPEKLARVVASMLSLFGGSVDNRRVIRGRETKQCLYCGKDHKHNNAFCSAEHAKLYKSKGSN